jgi:hypothetical protein
VVMMGQPCRRISLLKKICIANIARQKDQASPLLHAGDGAGAEYLFRQAIQLEPDKNAWFKMWEGE